MSPTQEHSLQSVCRLANCPPSEIYRAKDERTVSWDWVIAKVTRKKKRIIINQALIDVCIATGRYRAGIVKYNA